MAVLAGKNPLNRLELSPLITTRCHKISRDPAAIERLLVDLFLGTIVVHSVRHIKFAMTSACARAAMPNPLVRLAPACRQNMLPIAKPFPAPVSTAAKR